MNVKVNDHSDLFANFVLCGLDCFDGSKFPNVNSFSSSFEKSFMNEDMVENWTKFKLFWLDRSGKTLSSLIVLELCTYLANSSRNEFDISMDDVSKIEQLLEKIEDICLPRIIFKFERFKLLSLGKLVVSSPDQDLENFIAGLKIKLSFFDSVTQENLKDIINASPGIDEYCKKKLLGMLELDRGITNNVSESFSPLGPVSYEDKNNSQSVRQNVPAVFSTDLVTVSENAVKEKSSKNPGKKRAKGITRSQHKKRKKSSGESDSGEGNDLVKEKIDISICSEKPCLDVFKAKLRSHTKTSNMVEGQNPEGKRKRPLKFDSLGETDFQDKSCVASSVKEDKNFPPNETLQQNTKHIKAEEYNEMDAADTELWINKLDEKNNFSLGMRVHLIGDSKKIFEPSEKSYACNKCSKVFSSQSSYRLHSNSHRRQKCEVCHASFQGQAKLNRHRLTHTGEKPYKCQTCGSKFADKSHLNVHHRIHSGVKPFKCNICKASFPESTKLKNHKRIHSGEKPYVCEICGSSFSVSSSMKSHMKIHSGQKPYKCQLCDFASIHMSNLKTHMLSHSGEKKYACDICGVSFTETAKLRRHKMVHTGEKPYNCEVCGARFADKSHLTVHLRIHSGEKPFKCSYCPSAFIESTKLKNHLRTHTGEKPYMCEVCGMSFAVSYSLKSHLRKHTGEKPYRCKLCGYATSQSSNLKTHMLVHNGKKPHVCEECGASFSEPSKLNRHKKIHLDLNEDVNATSTDPKRTISDFPQNDQRCKTDASHFIHQEFKPACNSKSQSTQPTVRNSQIFPPNINLLENPVDSRHSELREGKSYRSSHIETGIPAYQYHNHQDVDNDYQHPFRNICSENPSVDHHGEGMRESYPETNITVIDQYHTTPNNQMSFSDTKHNCHSTSGRQFSNFSALYKPSPNQPPSAVQIELVNL